MRRGGASDRRRRHTTVEQISVEANQVVYTIAIAAIRVNRSQPRTRFDEQAIAELAESIREHGLLQPLIVTAHPAGGYELIAGERRWRAARLVGLSHVPALLKEVTPQQLLELALVENVQRADLNPLEEGRAYQTLKDEFGLKDDEIARRVGKNRVSIVNARRLLRLAPQAQQALLDGAISAGHGRALLRLEHADAQNAALTLTLSRDLSVRETERLTELAVDERLDPVVRQALLAGAISSGHAQALAGLTDPQRQVALLVAIEAQSLGVRETERLCAAEGASRNHAGAAPAAAQSPRQATADDAEVQRMFEVALGTPVQLARNGKAIRLTIVVYSDEQLQGLYDLVSGAA